MEFFKTANIKKVKKYWQQLISNDDKRVYQSYDFNKLCYKYRKSSLSAIKKRNTKCLFIVLVDKNIPLCIAPLNIDTTPRRTVRLLGHGTNAAYLDFIYNDPQYAKIMYRYIAENFIGYEFDFIFVPQYSPLIDEMDVCENFSNYSIGVTDYAEWFANLSKSTRQNIRTAYNRIQTDQHIYSLKEYKATDCEFESQISICNDIYQKRRLDWGIGATKIGKLKSVLFLKRDVVYNFLRCKKGVLTILFIDDKVSAFFVGFEFDNGIYIPRLAIDTTYSRYSPGVVLINEYLKVHTNFIFDLCRGDEGYKKQVGGINTMTYRLKKREV